MSMHYCRLVVAAKFTSPNGQTIRPPIDLLSICRAFIRKLRGTNQSARQCSRRPHSRDDDRASGLDSPRQSSERSNSMNKSTLPSLPAGSARGIPREYAAVARSGRRDSINSPRSAISSSNDPRSGIPVDSTTVESRGRKHRQIISRRRNRRLPRA